MAAGKYEKQYSNGCYKCIYMYVLQAGKLQCNVCVCVREKLNGKRKRKVKIAARSSDSQTVRAARKQLFVACHKNTSISVCTATTHLSCWPTPAMRRIRKHTHINRVALSRSRARARALSPSLCCAQRKQKQTIKSAAKWPFEREIRAKTKRRREPGDALRSQRV